VEQFKREQRDRLAALCSKAGADDAEALADSLYLLLEGARVSRQSVGPDGPCSHFVRAADTVIASFVTAKEKA
jgi:hypothetical protein